jgi:dienelactone hydrolase
MTDREAQMREMAKKLVVYSLPGMADVTVRRDLTYQEGDGSLVMDLYEPLNPTADVRPPVVVIVMGYPDPTGFYRYFGWATCWARMLAVSGVATVIYATREPAADIHMVLRYLRDQGATLGIDGERIGILACSANVAVALSALMTGSLARCGALLNGYTMDLDGGSAVAAASSTFGFVNACAGKSMDALATDVPLFLVRSGRDQGPGLNGALDRFIGAAVARNLPVAFVNHPTAPHAFDVDDDSKTSHRVIRQVLSFLCLHLEKD